jgi:urease accessory protein
MAATGTDAALLSLAQWLSPAFPVGGYTFSQGLEWAIATGEVTSAADLGRWLGDTLEHGAGRCDAILLGLALRDAAPLQDLADLAAALAPARERRMETEAQGTAFAAAMAALGRAVPAVAYPLAVGVAARGLGLPAGQVAALWLQAWAGNLVQIAVRLVPLGQGEGQAVLAGLQPPILRIAAEAATAGPEALGSAAFMADLAAMHHETMEVRLCRT